MTTSGDDGACGRAFMAQTGRFGFRFHVITSCWCVLPRAPPVVGRAQRYHASAGAEGGARAITKMPDEHSSYSAAMRLLHLSLLAIGLVVPSLLLGGCAPATNEDVYFGPPGSTEPDWFQPLRRTKKALAGLPFRLESFTLDSFNGRCQPQGVVCDPAHPKISIIGPGLATKEEILAKLNEAGFDAAHSAVEIMEPPIYPPAGQLPWPVSGAVVGPGVVRTGSTLNVQVQLWNLTLQHIDVAWEACTIDALILDDHNKPATYTGKTLCTQAESIAFLKPLDTTTISSRLDLTRFNPALPLVPGRYKLRVRLENLNLSLKPVFWVPGESKTVKDSTLPDVAFEIAP